MSTRSPLARIATLLRSPLAIAILLAFFAIAFVESAFLGVLTQKILETDKQAEREYRLLKVAKDLSEAVQTSTLAWGEMDLVRKDPLNEEKGVFFHATIDTVYKKMETLNDDLLRVGIKTQAAKKAANDFRRLEVFVNNIVAVVKANPGTVIDFNKIQYLAVDILVSLITNINATFSLIEKQVFLPYKGNDISTLFYFAIAANVVVLTAMALAAERGITRPIRLLAENCSRITSGELMAKPKAIRNEISSLEQSFYSLSLQIQENETRRKSNLELLQAMQTAALGRIESCFQALLSLPGVSERASKKFSTSLSSLNALKQLLDTMTAALQKGGSTAVVVKKSASSSGKILDAAVASTESLITKNSIKLVRQEDGNTALDVDEQLVVRVLINFLSNAIKYSPPGGEIELVVQKQADKLLIYVRDHGPGISAEGQKKLFAKFSQVEAADGVKRQGTGLGLMICKEIIEKHGGDIGCQSEVGDGSKFWFTLPLAPASALPAASSSARAQSASGQANSTSIAKTGKPRGPKGGLKKTLGLMLLAFLIPQLLVAANFQFKFNQISAGAKRFYDLKETLFKIEEVYFLFLTWRMNVALALDKQNYAEVPKVFAAYRSVVQKSVWIRDHSKPGSFVHKEMLQIMIYEKKILQMMRGVLSNPSALTDMKASGGTEVKAHRLDMQAVDEGFARIMERETSKLKEQYTSSNKLREEILISLGVAAFLNLCVLIAVSIIGLRIIEKISAIQLKSVIFASGANLEATIEGGDELTYLDQRLVEACAAIREAQSEQQALMSVINHDLRTPLASILSVLEMTMTGMYVPLSSEFEKMVSGAHNEVGKLLARVSDLLNLEKIDAGAFDLRKEDVPLKFSVEKAVEQLRAVAAEKSVDLVLNFDPALSEALLAGDNALIERSIEVVLENAITALDPGGQIQVNVTDSRISNEIPSVRIEIVDNGPGIDNRLLEQIFQRFRAIDGSPVSGLGLPLAQRIALLHDGELRIESITGDKKTAEQGTGTRAIFQYPLSKTSAEIQAQTETAKR